MLINPPYQTITSNVGVGHQIPLGLLMVGGPLLDAGYTVKLLDAECDKMPLRRILNEIQRFEPQVIMTGHAGSTPAHPVCMRMLNQIKTRFPGVITVYGGVYPTFHAEEILSREHCVDLIVRGEGEATTLDLIRAIDDGKSIDIPGIAYRNNESVVVTHDRPPIQTLDNYRVGWELIENWDKYRCFGMGRAAIIQFSRGCPHKCTYCGQHGFWVKWRYRDPIKLVNEVELLHRRYGINFFTLADENPTTLKTEWRTFLEGLALRRLPVYFFATIRATDIVRDEDILPLYRKAGILYVLMGIESTNNRILRQIGKGSTTRHDLIACRLLKKHGIFSVIGYIVGFEDEKFSHFRTALNQLNLYNGDYLNAMYVTPHSWTQFGKELGYGKTIQKRQVNWDYRHQILGQKHLKPWQLFLAVKWLELCFHLSPNRLWKIISERDGFRRKQWYWSLYHTAAVWLAEIMDHLKNPIFR